MASQRIKYVPQRGHGCGIACVAMLAGVTYDKAEKAFPNGSEGKGSFAKDVIAALACFGVEAEDLKPIAEEAYMSLGDNALLRGEIKEEGESPDWHWVVWDAERRRIIDPYRPKHEFRCTSYLRVARQP